MSTFDLDFEARATSRMPAPARVLCALLARIEHGGVQLRVPGGSVMRFGSRDADAAQLVIHDWRMASATLRRGDVGFGETYMDGAWDTPDLVRLLTLLAHNQAALERAFYGRAWTRALLRLRHLLQANTRRGSRRNILAHYDLGNAFYAKWLDPTMSYSSALFDGNFGRTLAAAQQAKYDRILAQLALPAGARVLEIGCGWGGFAETAARCRVGVDGISLSDAQTAYARERLGAAGLASHASVRIADYRDVRGQYDGIASIEMFEAVGERWWPVYFRTVHDTLKPGARACIQAITIDEARFDGYRTQSDFIQQFIFPGGMLASPTCLRALAADAGLRLIDQHRFGLDYAETLKRWLAAFDASVDDIRAQGFDTRFIRCWRFYLAYCAAGFASGSTDVGQYTFVRD